MEPPDDLSHPSVPRVCPRLSCTESCGLPAAQLGGPALCLGWDSPSVTGGVGGHRLSSRGRTWKVLDPQKTQSGGWATASQQPTLLPRNQGEAHRPPYLRCLEYLPRMCPEPEHPGVGQLGRQAERSLGAGPAQTSPGAEDCVQAVRLRTAAYSWQNPTNSLPTEGTVGSVRAEARLPVCTRKALPLRGGGFPRQPSRPGLGGL